MRPGEIEPRTRRWKKCVTLLDSKSPIQGLARSNQEPDDGKNASPCLTQKAPYKGLGAESEEKREPVSDIDTGVVVSLKVLDPDGRLEKRTKSGHAGMSALCQKRTHALHQMAPLFDHLGGRIVRQSKVAIFNGAG